MEQLILTEHGHRIANRGASRAAWRLVGSGYTVVYDHPDDSDWLVAAVVTVWRNK